MMSKRKVRALLAAMAFGAAVVSGPTAVAHANSETDFLNDLNANGVIVYDAALALHTGYAICNALNTTRGDVVAENLYNNSTWGEVPDRGTAATWVVVAGMHLCPWQYHPERATTTPGYVA